LVKVAAVDEDPDHVYWYGVVPPEAFTEMEPVALPKHKGFIMFADIVGGVSTLMLMEVGLAHCPAFGVNVYVPDAVLLMEVGDHVPEIPLLEVVGSAETLAPEQIGPIGLNVGVTGGLTVTVVEAVAVHPQELVTVNV
jgi:hypothetical protein